MPWGLFRKRAWALGCVCTSAAAAALLVVGSAQSAVLADYPDFTDVSELKLNGDAEQSGALLRLTSADSDETGTAFTKRAIVNKKKSFKTEFSFEIHDTTTAPGDGMAFIVHSASKSAIGDGGGGLGFGSIGDSVAVEFDTFDNGGPDENANEVAILQNGKAGKSKDSAIPAFSLYGGPRYAWIAYRAKSARIKAWVSDTSTKPSSPLVSAKVSLRRVFDAPRGRAGFTAATGGNNEAHDVMSWKLSQ